MFAAQKLGALAVPLSTVLTPAELDVIAADDRRPPARRFESLTAPGPRPDAASRGPGIESRMARGESPIEAHA